MRQKVKFKITAGAARRACTLAVCGLALLWALAACALGASAGRAAPAGCSLKAAKPKGEASFALKTQSYRVSDAYGWRKDPINGQDEFHKGIDLACAEGTPVAAVMGGVVVAAYRSQSYGNCLRVAHAGGWETLYAHLQYLYVRAGEVVSAGQTLGTAGQTGRATGAHLHFELKGQGTNYDPSALLGL